MSILEGKPDSNSMSSSSGCTVRLSLHAEFFSRRTYQQLVMKHLGSIHLLTYSRAVYIPTQFVKFLSVPPHLRFFFVSIVSVFWSEFSYSSVQAFVWLNCIYVPDTYLGASYEPAYNSIFCWLFFFCKFLGTSQFGMITVGFRLTIDSGVLSRLPFLFWHSGNILKRMNLSVLSSSQQFIE